MTLHSKTARVRKTTVVKQRQNTVTISSVQTARTSPDMNRGEFQGWGGWGIRSVREGEGGGEFNKVYESCDSNIAFQYESKHEAHIYTKVNYIYI